MNKQLKKFLKAAFWYLMFDGLILGYIGLIPGAQMAAAQTIWKNTTLSSAVSTANGRIVLLTSATGVNAPNPVTPNNYTFLYVDREAMDVEAVNGTAITVVRGAEGTQATTHASGAVVFVIQANLATYAGGGAQGNGPAVPAGSCTRANELALPRIQFASGIISDCLGGQWVNGDAAQTTRQTNNQLQLPPIGSVAYTSAGTSTTKATNTMYCTEIDLPYSKLITGLGMLNGAATGTDKWILALYDSGGTLLANSATAGVVASGNSTFQKQNFTTPYFAVGPAQYYACAQGDSGTTATINLIPTGTEDTFLAKKFASQTFGTLASIAVPTSFTTLSGGYWILF